MRDFNIDRGNGSPLPTLFRTEHLHGCTDKRAHDLHRKATEAAAAAYEKKTARKEADVEAQNLAAWQVTSTFSVLAKFDGIVAVAAPA